MITRSIEENRLESDAHAAYNSKGRREIILNKYINLNISNSGNSNKDKKD